MTRGESAQCEVVNRKHAHGCGHRVDEARGELVDAEKSYRCRRQPIEQWRLFDVGYEVEVRNDEIPQNEHLARDLSIAALVRLPEAVGTEVEEEQERGKSCSKPGDQ